MSSLVFLSTRNSLANENYNTFWQISNPRLNYMGNFNISLQNVEFANSVYPFNQYNNNIYFKESAVGVTKTAVITPNNYTPALLIVELKIQLEAANGTATTYTVTYDAQTLKITITPSAGTFTFVAGINDAYEELGFDENLFVDAAAVTGDYPVQLSGSRYVDILTNFSGVNYSVSGGSNVLVRVPLTVAFGNMVFYEPATDDKLFTATQRFDEIYVQLRDDRGNLWELPRNSHLSMTLKIDPIHDDPHQTILGTPDQIIQ